MLFIYNFVDFRGHIGYPMQMRGRKGRSGVWGVFFFPVFALAQIALDINPVTESFDSLASSGTTNPWVDNSTLPGWYAASVSGFGSDYRAGNGTSLTGDLYSFGNSSDRALGSVGSGTTGDFAWGVRLVNSSTNTLGNFQVTYSGEQWRNSGAATQVLSFSYRSSVSALTTPDPSNTLKWVPINSLDFTTPVFGGTIGAIDGNSNSVTFRQISLTGLTLTPKEELFLRWLDPDHSGNDHGLAIDNFTLTYQSVPEPTSQSLTFWVVLTILILCPWVKSTRVQRSSDRSSPNNKAPITPV